MKKNKKQPGSVIIVVIFIIALMTILIFGMLQISTEQLQLMQNQVYSEYAIATAQAGFNDAFSELRTDSSWTTGFTNKSFNNGSYTVTVTGTLPNLTVESTGTSSQGYVAKMSADITIGTSIPYVIRVDTMRINE